MSFLSKFFGKGDTAEPTGNRRQESGGPSLQAFWRVWFKDREEAKKVATDSVRLTMALSMQSLMEPMGAAQRAAIVRAAASGKYKIVPSVVDGDRGFDLVIYY